MSDDLAPSFVRTVQTLHELVRPPIFSEDEEIRIHSCPLTGDFNRLAIRLATVLDKHQEHIPIAERTGLRRVSRYSLKKYFQLRWARYNPFGGMDNNEKIAFETLINDLDSTVNHDGVDSNIRLIYSNEESPIREFHQDSGGTGRLLRSYNYAATEYVGREDILGRVPDDEESFVPKEGAKIYRLRIGDFSYHRHRDEDDNSPLKRGLFHRAQEKKCGDIPRLLLYNDF